MNQLDVYSLVNDARANPPLYGLTNVTASAAPGLSPGATSYDTSQIVPNPNQYLFWDDLHPTAGRAFDPGPPRARSVFSAGRLQPQRRQRRGRLRRAIARDWEPPTSRSTTTSGGPTTGKRPSAAPVRVPASFASTVPEPRTIVICLPSFFALAIYLLVAVRGVPRLAENSRRLIVGSVSASMQQKNVPDDCIAKSAPAILCGHSLIDNPSCQG